MALFFKKWVVNVQKPITIQDRRSERLPLQNGPFHGLEGEMVRSKILSVMLIGVAAAMILLVAVSAEGLWTDTHYSDFLQGIYDAEIYVSRRLQQEISPSDSGCIEYHAKFDVNNDGWYDLVSSDKSGPAVKIWLGSSSGYSQSNSLTYPVTSGGNCDISDLNLDGYPELLHSGVIMHNFCIYWGTATGPSPTDTTLLPNDDAEAIYVADFDKDTYLDIAMAGIDGTLYLYWGSDAGYSTSDRLAVSLGPMGHNIEASDLDMNGYLDMIVLRAFAPNDVVILYQTSPRNFTQSSLDFSTSISPHGLSREDLDNNGYIDIVATGYVGITHSSVYWGRQSGHSSTDTTTVYPGQSYGGSAIADFDGDSLPDILYFREGYKRPIIYYNSGSSPFFSDSDTQEIGIPLRATGGIVADFDYNGDLDVFINHQGSYSYVFYGPSFSSYDSLPVSEDHHGTFREPLQIPFSYYSRVARPCSLGMDTIVVSGNALWIADTPGSSRVDVFIRAGNTSAPDPSWTDWFQVLADSNSGPLPDDICGAHGYIQYRADLFWDNPAEMPNLERVEIDVSCGSVGITVEEEPKHRRQDATLDIFPNPFVQKTTIAYNLAAEERVSLKIYDITGKLIETLVDQKSKAENGSLSYDARELAAGIYFAKLEAGNHVSTRKLVVLR